MIATGGGNDLVRYNVGDGQDTVTDNGGFDTLALINVDASLAPSATAAFWNVTNTGTRLSVDTDAAGTIDEVAATGLEALSIQLGDGGDTVTLDGNLGAGGAGLFAITANGGLAGADGADIVDARTLSSTTGIVFNGGAGSDWFVSSNAGGTDTFNGGADGVTGDTVDYSAVSGQRRDRQPVGQRCEFDRRGQRHADQRGERDRHLRGRHVQRQQRQQPVRRARRRGGGRRSTATPAPAGRSASMRRVTGWSRTRPAMWTS